MSSSVQAARAGEQSVVVEVWLMMIYCNRGRGCNLGALIFKMIASFDYCLIILGTSIPEIRGSIAESFARSITPSRSVRG